MGISARGLVCTALGAYDAEQTNRSGSWLWGAAAHVLVRCPVSRVGRLSGSLLGCLRRDVALVSYCVPG
ncbi:hypothetical protein [Desulfosporosinus sp. OT]|uniref:hypothetical protein n=1 Tax=Desulfosporosinus sp. OT TaxID=913865 RepID=UPI001300C852|nr:hypothetical protein [Desulfosporosinus sp. OT]